MKKMLKIAIIGVAMLFIMMISIMPSTEGIRPIDGHWEYRFSPRLEWFGCGWGEVWEWRWVWVDYTFHAGMIEMR